MPQVGYRQIFLAQTQGGETHQQRRQPGGDHPAGKADGKRQVEAAEHRLALRPDEDGGGIASHGHEADHPGIEQAGEAPLAG